ncbi:MAG: ABC transporter ATP-binding protein [Syntrophales bacterium]|nr:ABC transporter ATP-binding protein [Syntrophales bacterium]
MEESAIRVNNISKKFRIYTSPKDRLKEALSFTKRRYHKEFWALRGVSFSLKKGTTMGILGINGSGKSTLLKIICGYLLPTGGGVRAEGRISSILELGTGFNRDFTGRENVILYGGLMGLSKRLVTEKMPKVEEFADIGDFFDRPMRIYSSGMYARLAFACAINTNPDILVIDEALAVGDVVFQHKCMHKIKQIQERGVTILFVSHSIGAIKSLCQEAVLLDRGRVVKSGKAEDVANYYHGLIALKEQKKAVSKTEQKEAVSSSAGAVGGTAGQDKAAVSCDDTQVGTGKIKIDEVVVLDESRHILKSVDFDQAVCVSVRMTAQSSCRPAVVGMIIRDYYGIDLLGTNTAVEGLKLPVLEKGESCAVDFYLRLPLLKGSYSITAAVGYDPDSPVFYDWKDNACIFEMLPPAGRKIVNCKLHLPIEVDIHKT